MGFHKRRLNENYLRLIFKDSGFTGLYSIIKSDIFICEDDFSMNFIDVFIETDESTRKTYLEELFICS